MLKFSVISLFPEMFAAITELGITGRAYHKGLFDIRLWNPRDFTTDIHRTVDDRPYGGGPGMVMLYQPLRDTINTVMQHEGGTTQVIFLTPQGKQLTQRRVEQLSTEQHLLLIAGRYEGIDERVTEKYNHEALSIGDYVLSGGELAAMVIIDAIVRLLPGALGHCESSTQDSFSHGLLDHPHYTRPEVIDEMHVPEILLSGNHERIRRWRLKQALGRTWQKRPDLLSKRLISEEEQQLLNEYKLEISGKN